MPFLQRLVAEHDVKAVVPLTDLDIEVLARADLPAFVPDGDIARDTFDKYGTHETLTRLGLPSPPTVLPGEEPESYPVMVKPRWGSGARSIHPAADRREMEFFIDYVKEPVMVQRLMGGPEFSIDLLCDLDGVCLNAIPRTMIESRGGESIKGTVIHDEELIDLGKRVGEALGVRGPCTVQAFRDPEIGLGITDVNTRFGGAFPAPDVRRAARSHLPRADREDGPGRTRRAPRRRVPPRPHVHALVLAARARRRPEPDRPRHRPERPAPAALSSGAPTSSADGGGSR